MKYFKKLTPLLLGAAVTCANAVNVIPIVGTGGTTLFVPISNVEPQKNSNTVNPIVENNYHDAGVITAANAVNVTPITGTGGIIIFVPIPDVALKGNSTINLIVGDNYHDAGVITADGKTIEDIQISGHIDTFKPGRYTITYTVIDNTGKTSVITRTVIVHALEDLLPADTNTYFAPKNEKKSLYFADPRPPENGKNRVIRVNYETMSFNENRDSIDLTGTDANLIPGKSFSNPHSVDRAGKTNKFYVRTQNAYSFDVISVENGKLVYKKSVPLSVHINGKDIKYSPRAFGAYNAKYDIQLMSARNSDGYNIVSIIDVKTDQVVKTVYKKIDASASTVTGHAKWLNKDYFAMIDRGNHSIDVYKTFINNAREIDAKYTGSIDTITPLHAIERVNNPKSSEDLNTFYLLGAAEGKNGSISHPFVAKTVFNPKHGNFSTPKRLLFSHTDYNGLKSKQIAATTHHATLTPDGKYIIVPVYDGKIYQVDRRTMKIVKTIDTGIEKGLGAGHIEISESLHIAVVTNHWSPYITIIDLTNFTIKGYLKIYRDGEHDHYDPKAKHLMQPHFAQISKDGKYFYTFASQDNGRFVKVNLEEVLKLDIANQVFIFDHNSNNSKVLQSIDVGGAPEQAHS